MSRRTPAETAQEQIFLKNKPLNRVEKFKYLGSTMSSDNESEHEIKIRTAAALQSMSNLDKIWRNRRISVENKKRFYQAVIMPIVTWM